jgi:hypothetical protein
VEDDDDLGVAGLGVAGVSLTEAGGDEDGVAGAADNFRFFDTGDFDVEGVGDRSGDIAGDLSVPALSDAWRCEMCS